LHTAGKIKHKKPQTVPKEQYGDCSAMVMMLSLD